jgi:sialic acid synthase SpsE
MSTPFDEQAVSELVDIGVKRLKIAGFESTDPRFVKMVASSGLPLIVSAGIGSNLNSIQDVINWIYEVNSEPDITILHCNNAYPTPVDDINLNRIDEIKKTYKNIKVGLSDHTEGIMAPCLAVAKGAVCIEKHFTLSRNLPGPDHPFAIEPSELSRMVTNIRIAEQMCSNDNSLLTKSEKAFEKAMRSVVALKNIKSGEVLTGKNITTKRPMLPNCIPASDFYNVLGKIVTKDISEDGLLSYDNLKDS